MPTYEYRCPEGHDFDKLILKISMSQATLPCPVCGKTAERRISAGGGLLFKGSGFYITDYGKDGKKDQRTASDAASKASPSTSSSTQASSSSSTDSSASSASGPSAAPAAPASTPAPAAPKSSKPSKPPGGSE